jgi:hypothetical protein
LRGRHLLLFLILVLLVVEFLDPALDAPQVEGLMALVAVPNGPTLVDGVLANNALLGALREGLHKEGALFCQIGILLEEVLEIVGDLCLILHSLLLSIVFLIDYLHFLNLDLVESSILVKVTKVVSRGA